MYPGTERKKMMRKKLIWLELRSLFTVRQDRRWKKQRQKFNHFPLTTSSFDWIRRTIFIGNWDLYFQSFFASIFRVNVQGMRATDEE